MAPAVGRGRTPGAGALFAVAALYGLGGCAAPPAPAAVPAGPAALAGRLPSAAAGFSRGAERPLAGGGGGREVLYATAGGPRTAAAAVELVPGDAGAEAALESALAEALGAAGPAREMREAGRFTTAAGGGAGGPLLCAETAGRYGRERVAGLVCAGRAGTGLVRLRVAMPASGPPPADPRAFAEAIAAALAGAPAG